MVQVIQIKKLVRRSQSTKWIGEKNISLSKPTCKKLILRETQEQKRCLPYGTLLFYAIYLQAGSQLETNHSPVIRFHRVAQDCSRLVLFVAFDLDATRHTSPLCLGERVYRLATALSLD